MSCMYKDSIYKLCHNGKCKCFKKKCIYERDDCSFYKPVGSSWKKILDWSNRSEEPHTLYVYCKNIECQHEKYEQIDYHIEVYNSLDEEKLSLPVTYCVNCKKYYIEENNLPNEEVMHNILGISFADMPKDYYSNNPIEKILLKYGYRTFGNESSAEERAKILKRILDSKIIDYWKLKWYFYDLVIRHKIADDSISISGNRKWKQDISRWEEDIRYISENSIKRYVYE